MTERRTRIPGASIRRRYWSAALRPGRRRVSNTSRERSSATSRAITFSARLPATTRPAASSSSARRITRGVTYVGKAWPTRALVTARGARGARRRRDRESGAHHVGVVDAAPEVAAVGHVAVLALDALAREAARLPLVVGVLEELAAERQAVGRELVTPLAELRAQERRRA